MNIEPLRIEAVKCLQLFRTDDDRGTFVKTFHDSSLQKAGIHFELKESFFSISHKDVIRGMHFHHPPYEHDKIVFCTRGRILDVVLDIRKSSPTYGQCCSEILSAGNNKALFIPKGFAHGFLSLEEESVTFYFVNGEYHAPSDDGIRFDSFGFNWPVETPGLSERDLNFQSLAQFQSPF
ncbi:MAG TPA: dTDP-4-dehydrorhamnose 3,5-epimerase family protein [Chitinophagaceae bacterium]|nr:dTDP-4-dehydrorhamnose 3,5-epimerase family protein [Chitinophagaceae bacterium]HNF70776.1 dTDP-4-dehydrorhamnose 3,5-epimerase family protein [Chitinophagaceae bacterium]